MSIVEIKQRQLDESFKISDYFIIIYSVCVSINHLLGMAVGMSDTSSLVFDKLGVSGLYLLYRFLYRDVFHSR